MLRIEEIEVAGWRRVARGVDREAGLDAIISVHDATLGPACGGCRVYPYDSFNAALEDVKRLSKGMTYKNALGGIPFGGGKSVIIADPKTDKTEDMMRAFGRFVDALGGLYYTAEDSGIDEDDIATIQTQTAYAAGRVADGVGGNPSPFTARGVWRGMKAAAAHRFGSESLSEKSVCVLGVGAVGMELVRLLRAEGARILVADVNEAALARARDEYGATIVALADAPGADVDIFSPCALGGSINETTIDHIRASIVAGAANNQLASPQMDAALRARGVLYAPDYVINAAGVVSVGLEILGRWTRDDLTARIDAIGDRLSLIFDRAASDDLPTGAVADAMALEIIEHGRAAA